jgi:cell division protein ZapA (FtsZ GTPase activity inhibitor)
MSEKNAIDNKTDITNSSKIRISLVIAERKYDFRIRAEEEEVCRKAAKMIRNKVLKIKEKSVNANRDAQDVLSIATLQFVIELLNEKEQNNGQSIHKELSEINADIENYLQLHEKK